MPTESRVRIAFLAITAVLTAAAGSAQPAAGVSFDTLAAQVEVGQRIWVTDRAGREVPGTLERISSERLVLKTDRLNTFTPADIRSVRAQEHDSLKNGALIGLAIGGGMATAWCIGAIADDSGNIDAGVECAEGFTVFPALGALIGLAVDAVIPGRMRVVYEAPPRGAPGSILTVVPLFSSRAKGVAVSFTF